MKREQIETAGRISRNRIHEELKIGYKIHGDINHYITASSCIEKYALPLFIEGAEWRINSVWHDNIEMPERNDRLLVELEDGEIQICQFKDGYFFLGFYGDCGIATYIIKRWAYLKDLSSSIEI